MVDFLFVIIEFFRYLLQLRRYKQRSVEVGVFRRRGVRLSKFQREGGVATNHCWTECWCQKTRVIALSCGIKISAVHRLVLSQYMHLTDRRTDRQNCDSNTMRCITCSHTVEIILSIVRFNSR